jgi:hypothetical protein
MTPVSDVQFQQCRITADVVTSTNDIAWTTGNAIVAFPAMPR